MNETNLLSVGFHKGEMDFGINGDVRLLSFSEMQKFREMIVVAIGVAERMWADEVNLRNPTSSTRSTTESNDHQKENGDTPNTSTKGGDESPVTV